jgi:hypothetical protein
MQLLAAAYNRSAARREEELRRYVERFPRVTVVSAGMLTDPEGLKDQIGADARDAGVALPPGEQKALAEKAITLLGRLATDTPKGFDLRPATTRIVDALRAGKLDDKAHRAALAAAARLPGSDAQSALAAEVLDARRKPALREAAATELARHVQKFGPALSAAQLDALRRLPAERGLAPEVKARVLALLGSLRPGALTTGERLRDHEFTPPGGGIIPPPKE